jgi:flagellar M-ring protein FliF
MEYRVSRRIERVEQLPGTVKRVSVAVLVKGELSPSEQTALRQAVMAAVGLDTSRGDTVAVVPVRFERTTVPQPLERRGAPKAPRFSWYWLAAVPVLLLIAASLLVAWRRRRRGAPVAPSLPTEVPEAPEIPEQPVSPPTPPVPEEVRSLERLREFVRSSPDRVADLIRSWLTEDGAREEGRR